MSALDVAMPRIHWSAILVIFAVQLIVLIALSIVVANHSSFVTASSVATKVDHEGSPGDQPDGKFLGDVWGHVVAPRAWTWGRAPTEAALPDAQFCDRQSRKLRRAMDTSLRDLNDLRRDHFR
jgi:hypothetical protein